MKLADACCTPVATVIVRAPGCAPGAMTSCAVAAPALVTVTGPNAPAVPPPTAMPGPKFARVLPFRKLVNVPAISTVWLRPLPEDDGFNWIEAAGFTVIAAALALVKPGPDTLTR